MYIHARPEVHILMVVWGLGLIVAGIAVGKEGAAIVGLIVAAVNYHNCQKARASLAPSAPEKP